ncbi:MAG: FAD-dependent oxidoreductase [Clostridia bacterium]
MEEKLYPHTLCCAYSDIDRHGQDRAFDGRVYQDWYVLSNLSTVTMKIRLPLEILIPKGWKRLVSVSRCLALDEYVSAAVRMNRDMYRLGESAGVAIAMAVQGVWRVCSRLTSRSCTENLRAAVVLTPAQSNCGDLSIPRRILRINLWSGLRIGRQFAGS